MDLKEAYRLANEVFALYEQYGSEDYIGEPVSQIEHMCQAAQLAEKDGYDDEVILAAFFHDIGHFCEFISSVQLMDDVGVVDHEQIGAAFLRKKGFSEKICSLVQSHVQAKRYLTYKYYDYYTKLSSASKITLEHQGGIMDEAEAEAFEQDPLCDLYIRLREWDDKAKKMNVPLPELETYKQMAIKHLLRQQSETLNKTF